MSFADPAEMSTQSDEGADLQHVWGHVWGQACMPGGKLLTAQCSPRNFGKYATTEFSRNDPQLIQSSGET